MPNLFKGYLAAGREYFVKHTQYQKDKYGYGENIDKDKLMTLALNNYKNLSTKEKCLAKSSE